MRDDDVIIIRHKTGRTLTAKHEGRVPSAYLDSLGFWTIGVGHLIDQRKGGKLPEHIIDALYEWDYDLHSTELFAELPWVNQLDEVRQAALIDMYFNLRRGLLEFKKFLSHVQRGEWDDAATEMHASKWAQQVGMRAVRLAGMMRTGEWPAL
jgi:lysozyme